jgi:3-oxoacid CoA-transferase subunit A
MNKLVISAAEAVSDIPSGASLAVGGFGVCGVPDILIEELLAANRRDLTVYSNNCGIDDCGLGRLLAAGRIRRFIASYMGESAEFARQYLTGEIELELTPQGTLAERLPAGGAGIAAFYTPAGVGTPVADGGLPWRYHSDGSIAHTSPAKETREFGGRTYVLEQAIHDRLCPGARQTGRHSWQLRLQQVGAELQRCRRHGCPAMHRVGSPVGIIRLDRRPPTGRFRAHQNRS